MKFSWDNPSLQANHFHMVASPGSSGTMHRHAKTPCPGWEVATFREAAKRERQGDNLTGKQNSSTTIGTWRPETAAFSETSDQDCILSLLRLAIWTHSLTTKTSDLDPTVVDMFCLSCFVYQQKHDMFLFVRIERLLHSVKQPKESDLITQTSTSLLKLWFFLLAAGQGSNRCLCQAEDLSMLLSLWYHT